MKSVFLDSNIYDKLALDIPLRARLASLILGAFMRRLLLREAAG